MFWQHMATLDVGDAGLVEDGRVWRFVRHSAITLCWTPILASCGGIGGATVAGNGWYSRTLSFNGNE